MHVSSLGEKRPTPTALLALLVLLAFLATLATRSRSWAVLLRKAILLHALLHIIALGNAVWICGGEGMNEASPCYRHPTAVAIGRLLGGSVEALLANLLAILGGVAVDACGAAPLKSSITTTS